MIDTMYYRILNLHHCLRYATLRLMKLFKFYSFADA